MPRATTPTSVQRYELVERIASGGMGEVYRARAYGAHGFAKDVAIKRILPHLSHPELEQRFIAEAKVAARLTHANIVQVTDFGREGDALFIAMEYVEGVDLATVLSERLMAGAPIPLGAAVHIAIGLCSGLDFAHDRGVLHRDVSPANVLLSVAGEVKIADFGLAKAAGGGPTRANRVMGKWRYMSPEQSRAEPLDNRSDLFAAAAVIHELFTGKPLFTGRNPEAIIERIQAGAVAPPSRGRPDLPAVFDPVLARALSVDRERRFASGEHMARALTEACYASNLVHTAKDVARLVRERHHPAARIHQEPATDAGATRTFVRSGVDELGVSRWDVTTTYRPDGGVESAAAPPRPRRWWPALAGMAAVAAVVAVAVAAGRRADPEVAAVETAAAPVDARLVEADAAARAVDAAAPAPLVVTTRPSGAAVELDGERLGTTPLEIDVAGRIGPGRLRLSRPGHAAVELTIELGRPLSIHRRLEPLRSAINVGVTDSWARVYFRGKHVGDTPLRGLELPHGRHRLRLVNPETGQERTVTVTVPRSQPYVFRF